MRQLAVFKEGSVRCFNYEFAQLGSCCAGSSCFELGAWPCYTRLPKTHVEHVQILVLNRCDYFVCFRHFLRFFGKVALFLRELLAITLSDCNCLRFQGVIVL